MRKTICTAIIAAALILTLAGCSGSTRPDDGNAQGGEQPPSAADTFDTLAMSELEFSGIKLSIPSGWEEVVSPYRNEREYRDTSSGMSIKPTEETASALRAAQQ